MSWLIKNRIKETIRLICIVTLTWSLPGSAIAHDTGYKALLSCPPSSPVLTPAAGGPPPPEGCPGGWKQIWQSPLQSSDMGQSCVSYFNRGGAAAWHVEGGINGTLGSRPGMMNGVQRCQLGPAPDGRPSIKNLAPKGEVQNWNFFTNVIGDRNPRAAMVQVDIWIPEGFVWGHDQKLAVGLWAGERGCLSGGCSKSRQTGISLRSVHTPASGAKLYSYALNRTGNVIPGREFGQAGKGTGPIPKGHWETIGLEIGMNDIGKTNGYNRIYRNGVLKDTQNNMILRDESHPYKLRGLFLNDMWGGTEEAPERHSPFDQAYWYSNHKVFVCE